MDQTYITSKSASHWQGILMKSNDILDRSQWTAAYKSVPLTARKIIFLINCVFLGKCWFVRIWNLGFFRKEKKISLWKLSWETILRWRFVLRSVIQSRADLAVGVIPTGSCAISGHTLCCGDAKSSGCSTCHPAGGITSRYFYYHAITLWRTWPEFEI